MMVTNVTTVSGFLLLGLFNTGELQILDALYFLVMYLLGLTGNFIIITITTLDLQLQSPLYYFLKHLSLLDLSFLSVNVPQSIHNSLTSSGYISYAQCVLQVFFFMSLGWAEVAILTVMSYDRYVAICLPLHYEVIMSPRNCRWAVTAVWISVGEIPGSLCAATTFSIRFFRSKMIHQFFCDVPQWLKLFCSNDYIVVMAVTACFAAIASVCFIAITLSYVQVFSTVLRMPSPEGLSKVLSTCLPHLCVVSFYVSTANFAYLKPTSDSTTALDIMVSLFYTVLPPAFNRVIYSLRNKAMKGAERRLLPGGYLNVKRSFLLCC